MRAKKIILSGVNFRCHNRGVRALGIGALSCIFSKYQDAYVSIYSVIENENIEGVCVGKDISSISFIGGRFRKQIIILFASYIFKLFPKNITKKLLKNSITLRKFHESDVLVDLSLGDSFSELYGFMPLVYNSISSLIAFNMGCKVVRFPQTIGPFHSLKGRLLAKYILSRTEHIFLREEESIKYIKQLNISMDKVKLSADVAFLMKPVSVEIKGITEKLIKSTNSTQVGINISGLLYDEKMRDKLLGKKFDYEKMIVELINELIIKNSASIILIPHTYTKGDTIFENDLYATRKYYSKLTKIKNTSVKLIEEEYSAQEIKYIISKCDFFIGSRMHACIAAMSTKVPTVAISYSHKFKGVFSILELEDCVFDLRLLSEINVIEKVISCYKRRNKIKDKLEKNIPIIENKAYDCVNYI